MQAGLPHLPQSREQFLVLPKDNVKSKHKYLQHFSILSPNSVFSRHLQPVMRLNEKISQPSAAVVLTICSGSFCQLLSPHSSPNTNLPQSSLSRHQNENHIVSVLPLRLFMWHLQSSALPCFLHTCQINIETRRNLKRTFPSANWPVYEQMSLW